MYVSSLQLNNIRTYQALQLQFSKSINLLVGQNNSGKSTLIKAIYKLQNINTLELEDIRKSSQTGRIFVNLKDISERDKRTFELANQDEKFTFPETTETSVYFGFYHSDFQKRRSQETRFWTTGDAIVAQDGEITFLLGETFSDQSFHPLPQLETQYNFIYPFFAKRKTGYYTNQTGSKESDHVSEDLRNITAKIQNISNASHPSHDRFIECTRDILGFNIGVVPDKNDHVNTGVYVNNKATIPISSMGEGVVNILGLLVMLFTEDQKLYLIEELENDIHPKALKKLLQLIIEKSEHNQFIISTHSNIVVKYLGIKDSKIFHLKWSPYQDSQVDRLPTTVVTELGQSAEERLALLSELGYDVFDFDLYKSYLIFEESSAERLFRDFLIPIFHPALRDKVRTIAASGAADLEARFHDFLKLFVFIHNNPIYHSRAWVIADGDSTGKKHIESLRDKFKSWEPQHFIALPKDNIEEFFPSRFQEEFQKINAQKDKSRKREEKKAFFDHVMEWIGSDPKNAKTEFATSAAPLIEILAGVAQRLE